VLSATPVIPGIPVNFLKAAFPAVPVMQFVLPNSANTRHMQNPSERPVKADCVKKLENQTNPYFSQNAFFLKVRFNFNA
jgi:hypothetical protein